MEPQDKEEKIKFLKETIGADVSHFHGNYYRAAAYVKGGTYLSCVTFRSPRYDVESAARMLERSRAGGTRRRTTTRWAPVHARRPCVGRLTGRGSAGHG